MNHHRFLRISLKELLLALAFVAVACAALTMAGTVWWMLISGVTMTVFLTCAILSAVEREARQAFAMGFVICGGIYYGLYAFAPKVNNRYVNREGDPSTAIMPTSMLLGLLYSKIARAEWIDSITGKPLANYQPLAKVTGGSGLPSGPYGSSVSGFGGMGSPTPMSKLEPDIFIFMAVGHMLWTLLLGYIGGHFAQIVYRGREARMQLSSRQKVP